MSKLPQAFALQEGKHCAFLLTLSDRPPGDGPNRCRIRSMMLYLVTTCHMGFDKVWLSWYTAPTREEYTRSVDDLLTTKQLQGLLQVDRITIYRMLSTTMAAAACRVLIGDLPRGADPNVQRLEGAAAGLL